MGNPKVGQLDHSAPREHHVAWLDVSVDEGRRIAISVHGSVRVTKGLEEAQCDMKEEWQRDFRLSLTVHFDGRREVNAIYILHDHEVLVADTPKVEDSDNVCVFKLTQQSRFTDQLANEVGVHRQPLMQPLEGYSGAKAIIAHSFGKEDICHASFADL